MASDPSPQPSRTARVGARWWLPPLTIAGIIACGGDGGVMTAPPQPSAYTRFVHAVPDTGASDWRFIDQIELSPPAFNLPFRGFTPYQATAPGLRRLRVFPSSTNIDVTSRFLIDTVLTFEPDVYYTLVHLGYARDGVAPRHRILLLRDEFPRQQTGDVAVRAVHLGSSIGDVDVLADTSGGGGWQVLVSRLSHASATSYAQMPPGSLVVRFAPADDSGESIASGVSPEGEPAVVSANLTAIGGSRMPGSAISALLFPRSVAGSSAPQGPAFSQPGVGFLIDRHPR